MGRPDGARDAAPGTSDLGVLLSAPEVTANERAALLAAFDGGWIAPAGPDLAAFELDLAAATGRAYAVGLASGTSALHLGLLALGVGAGDEVLVPTLTFVATANAVMHAGATPVFVDCDATWTMDPDLVEAELDRRARAGSALRPRSCRSTSTGAAPTTTDPGGRRRTARRAGAGRRRRGARRDATAADPPVHRAWPPRCRSTATRSSRPPAAARSSPTTQHSPHACATSPPRHASRCCTTSTVMSGSTTACRTCSPRSAAPRSRTSRGASRAAVRSPPPTARHSRTTPGVTFMPEPDAQESALGTVPTWWLTCLTLEPGVARCDRDGLIAALAAHGVESRPVWKPMHLQPVYREHRVLGGERAAHLFETGVTLPYVHEAEPHGRPGLTAEVCGLLAAQLTA
jgi:hypothetical protein